MIIGIDGTFATLDKISGIGYYTLYLIKHLSEIDTENQYIIFYDKTKTRKKIDINKPNFSHIFYNPFTIKIKNYNIDVFHHPGFKYLDLRNAKVITTIHDTFSLMPDRFMSDRFKKRARKKLLKAVKLSDHIIAVSKNTKNDIIRYTGIDSDKISVIYHGVDNRFKQLPQKNVKSILKKKYNINFDYILFVGNIETRKNILRAVAGFLLFKNKYKIKRLKFVITGSPGYGGDHILRLLNSLKDEGIIYMNYISHTDLPVLYCGAKIFLFPSLYEGFGLPVIEAARCGIPVISSNNSSIKEIASKFAVLIHPSDIVSIADSIYNLLSDKNFYNLCRKNGLKFSKKFTWENTAKKTLNLYKKLAGEENVQT